MDRVCDRFARDQRVELHPATRPSVARGRFGNVVRTGTRYVYCLMDRDPSHRVQRFTPEQVLTLN